jgi:hypothetical protein
LREAKIWGGRGVDAREWLYIQEAPERMSVLLIQAKVARGLLKREVKGKVAIYRDSAGQVQERIPIDQGRKAVRFIRRSGPKRDSIVRCPATTS